LQRRGQQRFLHGVLARVELPVPPHERAEHPRRKLPQQVLDAHLARPLALAVHVAHPLALAVHVAHPLALDATVARPLALAVLDVAVAAQGSGGASPI
jgi:hypothetical protein